MFFPQQISELRQFYLNTWQKFQQKQELSALEQQIAQVLSEHPEYHSWLNEENLDMTFHPEIHGENPFLHMGLHLAIREQLQTNRPLGIREIYFAYVKKNNHLPPHEIEHIFMDVLAKNLWMAQRLQQAPDEAVYLKDCQQLIA
jgi:phage pi2 protein 07